MSQAIDEIAKFQKDRELDKEEYDPTNEHINIVEELLESVGFDVPKRNRNELEMRWFNFIVNLADNDVAIAKKNLTEPVEEYDKVDAYADVIVFAVGTLMKLGYDAEKVLLETAKEINSRTGEMVNGKFEKDLSAVMYKADYTNCKKD